MKKILVALDYGDTCNSVFNQALELARSTEASLHLLRVLTPENDASLAFSPYSDKDWDTYAEQYRVAETAGLKLLEGFADKAKAVGIETELTQAMGNPGAIICQLAKTWEANLIVVGSRGRTGLSEMLLGSVSNYVVHHAPCSVFVFHSR
ncbi:MAG: universal stress protein [Cyanobacteria bacterium J06648_16]